MELFVNLLWLAIAISALVSVRKQPRRVQLAVGCTLVLLFPIISVSDDLLPDRAMYEDALALVVEAVTLVVIFVTVARVIAERPRRVTLLAIASADPRSPPLA
ncbi:MAG TPA: hypothetical protein VI391_06575 [Thermoanaerobaculia bacterium]